MPPDGPSGPWERSSAQWGLCSRQVDGNLASVTASVTFSVSLFQRFLKTSGWEKGENLKRCLISLLYPGSQKLWGIERKRLVTQVRWGCFTAPVTPPSPSFWTPSVTHSATEELERASSE